MASVSTHRPAISTTADDDTHVESRRIRFVLFTMGLLLALNAIGAYKALGWKAITCNVALVFTLDCLYAWRYRDAHLGRWLLLGLTAGIVELFTDWWLVRTETLVYAPNEPMIWASPAYMPFAWAVVLVQLSAVGFWLYNRLGWCRATILIAVISSINIPIYEHLAKNAQYWFYQHTPMLFDAPYYVIAAEFLLALPLAWMAKRSVNRPLGWSVSLGVVEGAWMFPVVVFTFWLLGPCVGAVIQLTCN